MFFNKKTPSSNPQQPLQEGRDFYLENGLYVFTEHFLRERGWCCENGCRHCPYGFQKEKKTVENGGNPDTNP